MMKKAKKSEQLMFRASKPLAQAIRKAAASRRRSVADWLRQTVEAALGTSNGKEPTSPDATSSWNEQVDKLAQEGWLIKGTQKKTQRLLEPPPGKGPSGVLDALLQERREGR
jgi:hypothetical protein